ncbi:MAG: carbon starvation protein A, partial [Prolixibacteraceae bacterium]|nr:carbon starvation protein A [Prolixibacteraceae bacterium]
MITVIICFIALFLGYMFYSRFVERYADMNPDNKTPAYTMNDGVDYLPM